MSALNPRMCEETGSVLVSLRIWFGKGLGNYLFFPVDSATMIGGLSSSNLHVAVLIYDKPDF